MRKKNVVVFAALLTVTVLVGSYGSRPVSAWSNGGYSTSAGNPVYGTHDWIAEHALDWLPQQEKQFLLDNKASYLYGTELPDNDQAPDGIGDTTKHHIYYYSNEAVQDDAAAVRAKDEYAKAVSAYHAGNVAEAAKRLGVVAHYIGDMAVFGHVMASSTVWGNESHHSDYEEYVQKRTNSYVDEFNSFLAYDGALVTTSAYGAARTLAYDTTFDANGDLTCVWMDKHYNWNDVAFKNRAGESLNLAVNVVADVLHTFYGEAVVPEFPSLLLLPLLLFATLLLAFAGRRFTRQTSN